MIVIVNPKGKDNFSLQYISFLVYTLPHIITLCICTLQTIICSSVINTSEVLTNLFSTLGYYEAVLDLKITLQLVWFAKYLVIEKVILLKAESLILSNLLVFLLYLFRIPVLVSN